MEHSNSCAQCTQAASGALCKKCLKKKQKHEDWIKHKAKRQATQKLYYQQPEHMIQKKQTDKEYYEAHKEHKLSQFKEYWVKNKDILKQKRKLYNQLNKEKIAEQKQRQRKQVNNLLKEAICRRMNRAIKDNDTGSGRWFKYLGCSLDELKNWFAYLFPLIDDKMSFENHGTYWHIDHVRPVSSFDLTNENNIHECFSWKNLSPLEKSKNLSKHSTIDLKAIQDHQLRVEYYEQNIKHTYNQIAQTTADL